MTQPNILLSRRQRWTETIYDGWYRTMQTLHQDWLKVY